jgi:N-acetylglucosaminyldiphosphoundecaprenol N-acetyl-beta-D-mannosaminyltransferase
MEKDESFRGCYSGAAYATADGVVNSILHYVKRWPRRERIAGADLFEAILSLGTNDRKLRCFFFGADEATLVNMKQRIRLDYPYVSVVGCISPPYTDTGINDADRSYVEAINVASPDVLFVGLTQPKQERWVHENFSNLNTPVTACIGAVFDFYAGNKVRAPTYIRKLGLEWLVRLVQNPVKIAGRFRYALPVLWRLILSGR